MVLSQYKFSYSNMILFVQLVVSVLVLLLLKRTKLIELEDFNMTKVKQVRGS